MLFAQMDIRSIPIIDQIVRQFDHTYPTTTPDSVRQHSRNQKITLFPNLPVGYEQLYVDILHDHGRTFLASLNPLKPFLRPNGIDIGLRSLKTASWIAEGKRILRRLESELPSQAMKDLNSTILTPELQLNLLLHRDPDKMEAVINQVNAEFPKGIIVPPIGTVLLARGEDPFRKEEWWITSDKHGHSVYEHSETRLSKKGSDPGAKLR